MKIFTHRGWSAGEIENSLLAFRKSVDAGVEGVEFDVRYGADGKTVVCAHDPVSVDTAVTLDEVLQYLETTKLELLIELKEYSDEFYEDVVCLVRNHDLADRTTIFGFPQEAQFFPWRKRQDVKLGIIAPYPQDIKRYIEMYEPDMVLLGWGNKKERLKFKLAWSALSLPKTFAKYSQIKFVIGVAYDSGDKKWLSRQQGLYGITADMPIL
ncbi:MAG: glycerophosphodiester phosphodiesterase [Minisyncoccia bacterium]